MEYDGSFLCPASAHGNLPSSACSRWMVLPSEQQWSVGEFQPPETPCALMYTLRRHQLTFPLHDKRVWGGSSANAACRWILEPHFASKGWLTWVCAGTPSQHTCLNPVCLGSSAPAADANEVLKKALRLRRLVVEEEQELPAKRKRKRKKQ